MTILTETKMATEPPNSGNNLVAFDFFDDDIKKIGDEISRLTPKQSLNLSQYLRLRHGIAIEI